MAYKQLCTTSVFALAGVFALVPTVASAQAAGGTGTVSTQPADASDQATSEIVVTAQRRNERQVDVPISITALGTQQLQTANVQTLGDIQKLTPSLRFDGQTSFVQPSIRGIGTGITTSGGGSNVGIYIDGFYSPNPIAADLHLTKVSSIQVLKGPQGTLFGHNTTGGAILVTTADPSEDPEVDLKASFGRYNAAKFQGYATFGVAPGVAVDVEEVFSKGNGYFTNIVNNDNHVGAYQDWTVRGGLKIELSPDVSVLARYQHSDINDPTGQMFASNTDTTIDPTTGLPFGTQTFTVPGTYTTKPGEVAQDVRSYIHTKTDIAQLTLKADLGFANFTSYSQWRRENTDQSENLDQTALPIFQLGLPIRDTTYSQEFLLTSKPGPRLQWTAGFFFFSNKDNYITDIDFGTPTAITSRLRFGGSSTTTQSYAGFLDATYQITDKLFLTAGTRYSHDIVKDAYWNTRFLAPFYTTPAGVNVPAPNGVVPVPGISSNHLTPRAVIRFKPDERSSIYASYTKGYKAAIIDVGGSCQNTPYICNPVKPENIDAFEIGYKYDDRRLQFELSGFYYNYKNLQVSEFLQTAEAFIVNAAKSRIYGIDGEVHYKFGDHVQLNAGAAWTHARYVQFGGQAINTVNPTTGLPEVVTTGTPIYSTDPVNCYPGSLACYFVTPGTVQTGAPILRNVHMQHVPDFTATFGPRFTTGKTEHGEFALSGNLYYTSSFFFSPSGTQFKQPAYATVDARLQWDDPTEHFMVAVYVTNLTNKEYREQTQFNGFGAGSLWSQPRSWGLEVGAKF